MYNLIKTLSSLQFKNAEERHSGKDHVGQVDIVLLRHEAFADSVALSQAGQEEGGVGLVAPAKRGHRPLSEGLVVGATSMVSMACTGGTKIFMSTIIKVTHGCFRNKLRC